MSSIEELKKIHKEREKLRLEPYKIIHNGIWLQIEERIKLNTTNQYVVEIPAMIFGYTQYIWEDCIEWQINELQKKGKKYLTVLRNGNELTISWNFNK